MATQSDWVRCPASGSSLPFTAQRNHCHGHSKVANQQNGFMNLFLLDFQLWLFRKPVYRHHVPRQVGQSVIPPE